MLGVRRPLPELEPHWIISGSLANLRCWGWIKVISDSWQPQSPSGGGYRHLKTQVIPEMIFQIQHLTHNPIHVTTHARRQREQNPTEITGDRSRHLSRQTIKSCLLCSWTEKLNLNISTRSWKLHKETDVKKNQLNTRSKKYNKEIKYSVD